MSPETTTKGFIVNGMIDVKTHPYPDIIKMLRACKYEVPKDQEETVFLHFSELYAILNIVGHIIRESYDRLGFNFGYKLRQGEV